MMTTILPASLVLRTDNGTSLSTSSWMCKKNFLPQEWQGIESSYLKTAFFAGRGKNNFASQSAIGRLNMLVSSANLLRRPKPFPMLRKKNNSTDMSIGAIFINQKLSLPNRKKNFWTPALWNFFKNIETDVSKLTSIAVRSKNLLLYLLALSYT